MDKMKESVEGCLVYSIENREELLRITNILSNLIGETVSLYLPIKSFKVTHEDHTFRLDVTTIGEYLELQETPSVSLSVRQLCDMVEKLLACAAEAEAQLGTALGVASLYFSRDLKDVRLSPLMTQGENGGYLAEMLTHILGKGRAGSTHFACLSDLMNQIRDKVRAESAGTVKEWWAGACSSAAANGLPQLNKLVQSEEWEPAQDLLDWTLDLPLCFSVCMSRNCVCPQEPQALVWACARHCFGSEQCRKEAGSSTECPLCSARRLVVIRPRIKETQSNPAQQICSCGQEFTQSAGEWRLLLLGSTQYENASKCCSEACFLRFFSAQPVPDPVQVPEYDPNLCLECKAPLPEVKDTWVLWYFPCQYHGFCSSECQSFFCGLYVSGGDRFDLPCLFCTREVTSKIRGDGDCYEPMLAQLEALQQAVLSTKTRKAVSDLKLLRDEIRELILERKAPKDPRPLYLSLKKLRSHVWLLNCCICQKPTVVYKYSSSAAFLVRCEFKIHCVCSPACAKNLTKACPLCPDAELTPVSATSEATKAVLSTFPASHCTCREPSAFYELPNCSHSVCLQCLGNDITVEYEYDNMYQCSICSKKYEKELLMSKIFT